MTAWEATTIREIEMVCSYMGDDQVIANYFGIKRQRVEQIRASIRPNRRCHSGKEHYVDSRVGIGFENDRMAEEDARCGSQRLNEATQTLFRKWEKANKFKYGAAEILLPAGWVEQRDSVAA